MAKVQQFVLKKIVRASTAQEALALDATSPVLEVYPRNPDDDDKKLESCIGFQQVPAELTYEY